MTMRVHVLQHVPFEGLGSIGPWLAARDASIGYTRFYESPSLPDHSAFDLVIAMGGPMSVNDEHRWPWLTREKDFVREVVGQGTPLVGICLGAQLIAAALGARVYPNRYKEIGWFDIEAARGTSDCFRFPSPCTAFHWHGETFDLPPGAVRLASSAACENQAFQLGRAVIGLQFHLETTAESVESMIANCRSELSDGPYVKSEGQLREVPAAVYSRANLLMAELLTYVTQPMLHATGLDRSTGSS